MQIEKWKKLIAQRNKKQANSKKEKARKIERWEIMNKQRLSKKVVLSLILCGILVALILNHQTILTKAGRYLAPEGKGEADIVIIEGGELVKEKAVEVGLAFLASNRVKGIIIVSQQNGKNGENFGLPNYNLLMVNKLESHGIRNSQFRIINVPIEHPITLIEARIVLEKIAQDGIKRAILVAPGFHTRRSYWAYKQVGSSLGLEIIPHPIFIKFKRDNWWQHNQGLREFAGEFLKFFYYLLRGYIPVKSLLVT
jgi:uncharacterized SAM-binding protein YcdF (DUF218 family)